MVVTCSSVPQECGLADSQEAFYQGSSFAARHHHETIYIDDCDAQPSGHEEHTGTDKVTVNLRNGWVLTTYNWWWQPEGHGDSVQAPAGFVADSNNATIAMQWRTWTNWCKRSWTTGGVRYRVDLYAVGPKGVPHK
jgi:hypothetical protein